MCKCCGEINLWRRHIEREKQEGKVESKLFVKLSVYTWRKGERKTKGNQCGTVTTKAHDLYFCPMCR